MDFDEDYRCQFCHEFYDNDIHCPRILPKCGHTICTSCIMNKVKSKEEAIVCPDDNIITDNIQSLECLPINKTLLSILSTFDYARKSSNLRTSLKAMTIQTCNEHFLPLNFICFNHQKKICSKCKMNDVHINDTIISEEVFMNTIDTLIDLFEEIDINISTLTKDDIMTLPNLETTFDFIITQINTITTEITNILRDRSNKLVNQLIQRKKELQLKYESYFIRTKEQLPKAQNWLKIVQNKLDILNEINDSSVEPFKLFEQSDFNSNNNVVEIGRELVEFFDIIQKETNTIKQNINDYCETINVIQSKRIINEIDQKALVYITEDPKIVEKLELKLMFNNEERNANELDDLFKIQLNNKQSLEKTKVVFIKSQLKKEIANFSRIDIGDDGAEFISECLIQNDLNHIKELKLVKSNITDKGLHSILRALNKSNNNITTLNLSNNSLTDKSIDAIINLISTDSSLQILSVTQNLFTEEGKEKMKSLSSIKIFI